MLGQAQKVGPRPLRQFLVWSAMAIALVVSAHVWLQHGPQYFGPASSASTGKHEDHLPFLWLHILAASPALFLGPFALWSGLTGRMEQGHRWTGRVYLILGAAGVAAGMVLSVIASHRSTPNFSVGTFILGAVWTAAAAMAYRAIRNRQVQSHREWMIRSYVLTLSFVVCRLPDYGLLAPVLTSLGPGGDVTILWVGWVVPLCIAQLCIEWRRGARRA